MNHLSIYQTFHKEYPRNENCNWIQPVGVGGFRPEGFISDDTGDNIANLNPYYCELSVIYWVWKNTKSDYVGFYHYRRYLHFLVESDYFNNSNGFCELNRDNLSHLTSDLQYNKAISLLQHVDVLVPIKSILLPSIEEQYTRNLEMQPWNLFLAAIEEIYPQHKDKILLFKLLAFTHLCNNFIMKWPIFDSYCTDLFYILDRIYHEVGHPYDQYNNRYPGFLAERFLGFWLFIHNIKTIEVPMCGIE